MRPLTDRTPKPLVVVRGKPLIEHHIEAFVAMGIEEVVINVSYLADVLIAAVGDGRRFGCRITYSHEPQALESGGGIATASAFFSNALCIVASADIYSEIDIKHLLPLRDILWGNSKQSWFQCFDAHLALVPQTPGQPGGEFSLGENSLVGEATPRFTLANVAILKTSVVQQWPRGERYKLLPYYRELVAAGRVTGELFSGTWCNVTTPADVAALNAR